MASSSTADTTHPVPPVHPVPTVHPIPHVHPSIAIQPKATLLPHIKYWAPEGLNKPIAPIALQEVIQIAYRIAREHEIVPVEVYLRCVQYISRALPGLVQEPCSITNIC